MNLHGMMSGFQILYSRNYYLNRYSLKEKNDAYQRYINALSASVRGTGSVFLKRETKDVFTNNYNRKLMGIHKANHDIQMVVDQVKSIILLEPIHILVCFSMHVPSMLLGTLQKMNQE